MKKKGTMALEDGHKSAFLVEVTEVDDTQFSIKHSYGRLDSFSGNSQFLPQMSICLVPRLLGGTQLSHSISRRVAATALKEVQGLVRPGASTATLTIKTPHPGK